MAGRRTTGGERRLTAVGEPQLFPLAGAGTRDTIVGPARARGQRDQGCSRSWMLVQIMLVRINDK